MKKLKTQNNIKIKKNKKNKNKKKIKVSLKIQKMMIKIILIKIMMKILILDSVVEKIQTVNYIMEFQSLSISDLHFIFITF